MMIQRQPRTRFRVLLPGLAVLIGCGDSPGGSGTPSPVTTPVASRPTPTSEQPVAEDSVVTTPGSPATKHESETEVPSRTVSQTGTTEAAQPDSRPAAIPVAEPSGRVEQAAPSGNALTATVAKEEPVEEPTEPATPATIAEAANRVDFRTFPRTGFVELAHRQAEFAGKLSYLSTSELKVAADFYRRELKNAQWNELTTDPRLSTEQFTRLRFQRDGFTVVIDVAVDEETGGTRISATNHGNVDMSRLPKVADAENTHEDPTWTFYVTGRSLDDISQFYRTTFDELGWLEAGDIRTPQVVDPDRQSLCFFRNGVVVQMQLDANSAYAKGNQTVSAQASLRTYDLPVLGSPREFRYEDHSGRMAYNSAVPIADAVEFYAKAMPERGWEAALTGGDEKTAAKLYFKSADRLFEINITATDDGSDVTVEENADPEYLELAGILEPDQPQPSATAEPDAGILPIQELAIPDGSLRLQYDAIDEDIVFRSIMTPEELVDFYKQRLDKPGWSESFSSADDVNGSLLMSAGNQSVDLTVTRLPDFRTSFVRISTDGLAWDAAELPEGTKVAGADQISGFDFPKPESYRQSSTSGGEFVRYRSIEAPDANVEFYQSTLGGLGWKQTKDKVEDGVRLMTFAKGDRLLAFDFSPHQVSDNQGTHDGTAVEIRGDGLAWSSDEPSILDDVSIAELVEAGLADAGEMPEESPLPTEVSEALPAELRGVVGNLLSDLSDNEGLFDDESEEEKPIKRRVKRRPVVVSDKPAVVRGTVTFKEQPWAKTHAIAVYKTEYEQPVTMVYLSNAPLNAKALSTVDPEELSILDLMDDDAQALTVTHRGPYVSVFFNARGIGFGPGNDEVDGTMAYANGRATGAISPKDTLDVFGKPLEFDLEFDVPIHDLTKSVEITEATPAAADAVLEPADRDDDGPLLPEGTVGYQGGSTQFRNEGTAEIDAPLASVLTFYRTHLADEGWTLKLATSETDEAKLVGTKSGKELTVQLASDNSSTSIELIERDVTAAREAGIVAKKGHGRVAFMNTTESEVVFSIGDQQLQLKPGEGRGMPETMIDLKPGDYTWKTSINGSKRFQSDVEIKDGETVGVVILEDGDALIVTLF